MKSRHRPTAKIVILACTALGLVFAASPAAWLQEKKPDKAAGKDSGKKPQKGQEKAAPGKKKKRAEPVNRVNDAYITIKRERKKLVDKYLAELFAIADGCVKKKLPEPARRITDLILKVVEPPKNRKKVVAAASGVGLDAGGERVVEEGGPAVRVVPQKRLTPEEEAELKAARERVAKIREELGIGPDGEIQKRDGAPPETFEPPDPGAGDGGDKSDGGGGENKPKSDPTVVVGKKKEGGGDSKGGAVGKAKPVKDGDASLRERSARKTLMRGIEKLVKQCVEQRFPAQAYEILLWAIDLDPDNEGLRKLVRQYKYEKGSKVEWYSPFDLAKVNQGYKQHPEYGWVTDAELKALKSGMLWFKSKWHPREKVESERQKWENRWTYETEHFLIDTNADLSDAVAFGREVERLYAFFFRIFIDFYSNGNAGEDAKLVFGGGKELGKQKLRLHYYRSREHFLSEIAKDPECNKFPNPPGKDPLIAQSAGFYWGATHKAYFFRGPNGPDLSVIYHEVTHQVFGETYPSSGRNPPTWLVEGFGVFMEDPIVRGERLLAGAEPPPGIRKSDVRDINDFVKNYQNHNEFHGGKRGNNYATAGAVVHFFLYYKGGLYRQGFMQYAREGYRNNTDNEPTHIKKLYEYLKISEEQLQTDWEAFNADPDLFDF